MEANQSKKKQQQQEQNDTQINSSSQQEVASSLSAAASNQSTSGPPAQQQQQSGNVKVVLRVRPLNQQELNLNMQTGIEILDSHSVRLKLSSSFQQQQQGNENADNPSSYSQSSSQQQQQQQQLSKQEKPLFQFDNVFSWDTTQQEIFEIAAKPVVDSIFEGFNGTIFAYGQTSSGKTHTMQGPSIEDACLKGIIPRMVDAVFQKIRSSSEELEFKIRVSICEIYMEKIRDLLDASKANLHVREDKQRGIYIQDLTEAYVTEEADVYALMHTGNQNRAIGATNMNEGSSRSHMIFMMTVSQSDARDMSAKAGKLCLVDLAGSEKIAKTGAEGKTLDEAKRINQSLSELGNVINALTDAKQLHIPYRNSKLTRVLQESLGGNARTTLIITCSPSPFNEQETLSTLRFGARAKCVRNKPKVNKEWTVAELQILLQKAEDTIKRQEGHIQMLENTIQGLVQSVPEYYQDSGGGEKGKGQQGQLQGQPLPQQQQQQGKGSTQNKQGKQETLQTRHQSLSNNKGFSNSQTSKTQNPQLQVFSPPTIQQFQANVVSPKRGQILKTNSMLIVKPFEEEQKQQQQQLQLEQNDGEDDNDNESKLSDDVEENEEVQEEQLKKKSRIQEKLKEEEERKERILNEEKQKMRVGMLEEEILKLQDRIKELQEDNEFDKNNVHVQTQKLNYLRKEFTTMNSKLQVQIKENETMVQKLADTTLQKEQLEEQLKEKEVQIEKQYLHVQKQIKEAEWLKSQNDSLILQLKEKNEEFEILKLLRTSSGWSQQEEIINQKALPQSQSPGAILSQQQQQLLQQQQQLGNFSENNKASFMQQNSSSSIVNNNNNRDEVEKLVFALKADNKQLVHINSALSNTLQTIKSNVGKLSESELLSLLEQHSPVHQKLQREQQAMAEEEQQTVRRLLELENALDSRRQMVERLDAELHQAKGENARLQHELRNSSQLDDSQKQVINLQQRLNQLQEEYTGLQKDLHNRIDKVIQLEQNVDDLKDKLAKEQENKSLTERQRQKKLEHWELQNKNLMQMYSELLNSMQVWKIDSQASEKKLQRKNDRISELEQELRKTKDELVQLKMKHDSLMEDSSELYCRVSQEWASQTQALNMNYFGGSDGQDAHQGNNNNGKNSATKFNFVKGLNDMKNERSLRGGGGVLGQSTGSNSKTRQIAKQLSPSQNTFEMKDIQEKKIRIYSDYNDNDQQLL